MKWIVSSPVSGRVR